MLVMMFISGNIVGNGVLQYLSGVILSEETLYQSTAAGTHSQQSQHFVQVWSLNCFSIHVLLSC